MSWWAVYETATGRLESVGQQVVDPLPRGMAAVQLPDRPDFSRQRWDESSRTLVQKQLRDRAEDLLSDPDFPTLASTERPRLRTLLRKHFPIELREYEA